MVANQRVAVVTGASRGIGAAVVKAFRERGYSVVANSRSIKPSTEDGLIAVAGDIGDRAVARAIIDQGVARFGRIDTLVNNAGIFIGKPFTQYTPEDYASVLSTNMSGFFHISQYAIAEMEKRNAGHVVNITANVLTAIAEVPAVLALLTKGGIDAATRGLAIEYARRGIRINAVAPGVIRTPMHIPGIHAFLGALHPLGRMGEVSDIVDAVLYLEGADFVTGETLYVDGGQHVGH